jgi:hypothetical protein
VIPLLLALSSAQAAPPTERPVTLVGGVYGGMAAPEGGAGKAVGRLLLHFDPVTLEGAGAEGWGWKESREIGSILLGARVYKGPTYARLGFHHHHETAQDDFLADYASVLAGIGDNINHRSGVQAGVGFAHEWGKTIPGDNFFERWSTGIDLSVSWFPGSEGPPAYVGLEINQALHVGKKR